MLSGTWFSHIAIQNSGAPFKNYTAGEINNLEENKCLFLYFDYKNDSII